MTKSPSVLQMLSDGDVDRRRGCEQEVLQLDTHHQVTRRARRGMVEEGGREKGMRGRGGGINALGWCTKGGPSWGRGGLSGLARVRAKLYTSVRTERVNAQYASC